MARAERFLTSDGLREAPLSEKFILHIHSIHARKMARMYFPWGHLRRMAQSCQDCSSHPEPASVASSFLVYILG